MRHHKLIWPVTAWICAWDPNAANNSKALYLACIPPEGELLPDKSVNNSGESILCREGLRRTLPKWLWGGLVTTSYCTTNVTEYWPPSFTQTSAMQSSSALVSTLWIMTYWYSTVDAAQATSITLPTVTPTVSDPQSGYELMSTAEPADGSAAGNPTWKLFKPFTTAVQTKCL